MHTKSSTSSILFLLLVGAFICTSCEEVIDADLSSSPAVIVIEGGISDQSEAQTVKVSKTIAFDQPNSFQGVAGAKVVVYSSTNQVLNFPAVGNGIYRSTRFRGISGITYRLEVTLESKTYTASSVMPISVRPDSLGFKQLSFFGNSRVYPTVYYKDPINAQNQYRYIVKINNDLIAEQVTEDRFTNGNATSDLITFEGDGVKSGDKVDLEMQSIDRNVFKYYFAVGQTKGNGGPPVAPSNPDSNFNNGALGIFSAHTRSAYTLTLK